MSKPPKDDEIQLYTKILVKNDGKSKLPPFLKSWAHLKHHNIEDIVIEEAVKTIVENLEQIEEGNDEENDDESWETMNSSGGEEEEKDAIVDESKMSITQLVRKFFDDKK